MRLKGLHIVLLIFVLSKLSFGQTTVAYTGMGTVLCPAVPTATISPAVTGLTFSQLSRGSGVTCASAATGIAGSGFNVTLASALSSNKWHTNSITSDATVTFTVSSISVVSQVSAITVSSNVEVQYSIGGGSKVSIGSFTPTTASATYVFTPGTAIAVPASQTIDFFFIPNNLSAAGTTCRINNNTSFTVTTSPACTTPTIQASGISLSGITENQMTVNWSGNGNGDAGVIVVAKASSSVNSSPVSSTIYTANSIFGSGTQIGTGNYVVYTGSGSSVTVTGLSPQVNYFFAIYTYHAATPCYLTASPITANSFTLSNPPASHASAFAGTAYCTDIALAWTAASFPFTGANVKGYMILMRSDGTDPTSSGVVNGTNPVSLILPAGTTLAGTTLSTSITISGLSNLTTYNFAIIPYCWDATNASTYDYYTPATIPTLSIATTGATSTYYYRSKVTGLWNSATTWEASPTGAGGWVNACTVPTSAAAAVEIVSGHTVSINTTATAPNLTINGILTFENTTTARTITVTDYITIASGATFNVQSSAAATHTLTIGGNLTNSGTFDMTGGSGTRLCNVTFNKNGNQNVSGTCTLTRFNYIKVDMGTSRNNILNISTSNFSATTSFLHSAASTSANDLLNGTIKFSGSFTFTGTLLKTGSFYNVPSTAGIWLNNPNVTISGQNDSYNISGLLRVTWGGFYAGTANGNSIRLLTGSNMTVEGGTVNVGGRLQAANSSNTNQANVSYRQSGGIVTLTRFGSNAHGSIADFYLPLPSDSLIMSGGTIIFTNEATTASDIFIYSSNIITGGTFQVGVAASTVFTLAGFEIEAGSPIPSLNITQPGALYPYVYLGEHLTVIGNITIQAGTTLDNLWDATYQYNISLTENWNNYGTFTHNNVNTVTFNGTSAQQITGPINTNFNNLTLNNSSGGLTLVSSSSIASTGTLTFINGYFYTSSTYTLTMYAGSATSGANNNSFVYGPLSKIGTTNFVFPVGKDLQYRPIAISNLSGSETFTAEYFHTDPNVVPYDVTLKDATLDDIGRCEYWMLNRAGASVTANVALSWDTYSCGVTSLPDLAVARWNGSTWKDEGNTATTGAADPSTGTVTSSVVTSFSPFTLASRTTGVNPLPIELLSFTANFNSSNRVDLKWSTASETNNDFFTIERSQDGIFFNEIAVVDGAGNSTCTKNYSTIDNKPLEGVSYYRLKQTDYNGEFTYSSIVSVEKNQTGFEILNTQFIESQNQLAVYFNCDNNCTISIELFDLTGKKIYSSTENTLGENSEILIPINSISKGVYFIKAFNGEQLISKKIKL